MLRVWDCFLLEGPKILFRTTIAMLQMYKHALLQTTDTMSVLKFLKVAAKFTYDADDLLEVSLIYPACILRMRRRY